MLARAGVRLAELAARWNPYAVVVAARSPSDAAAGRALEDLDVPILRLNGADSMSAYNAFHEAVLAKAVVHPPDPMTASHIGAVSLRRGVVPPQQSRRHRRRGRGRLRPPRGAPRGEAGGTAHLGRLLVAGCNLL